MLKGAMNRHDLSGFYHTFYPTTTEELKRCEVGHASWKGVLFFLCTLQERQKDPLG